MRILAYVFAVLIGAVVGTLGYEYSMPVHAALRCTTRTCVVTYNGGGGLGVFTHAAELIRKERRWVVIDGRCISACTILADKARDRVCITHRATLEFHSGRVTILGIIPLPHTDVYALPYSPPIVRWINGKGGMPSADTGELLVMNYREASRFWPTCVRTGALLPDHLGGPVVRFLHFANDSITVTL